MARDTRIKESLRAQGLVVESFNAALLHEPWTIKNKSGLPFQVFTPFWKHCLTLPDPAVPLPAPAKILSPTKWPPSLKLEELALEPTIPWAEGIKAAWQPGEAAAAAALEIFLKNAFATYSELRNRPDFKGTSRLSPLLHFGEISPRQIWHGLREHATRQGLHESAWRNTQFLAEVGWRDSRTSSCTIFHTPRITRCARSSSVFRGRKIRPF